MADGDWIKLHRCILDSEVFTDDWLTRLWLWCLCKANFRDGTFRGQVIKRGQFVAGRVTGAGELNVAPSKWYRGMQRLEELGNVTLSANSNWTTVTICKYDSYQIGVVKSEQQVNSERTASEQQVNTIEEDQEFKKEDLTHTRGTRDGDKSTFQCGRSEAFNRFMAVYPRPKAPEAAWQVWQAKVYQLAMSLNRTDAEVEEMLIAKATAYRDSPAGMPPPGDKDFRPNPNRWLLDHKFEESPEVWQEPNGKPPAQPRGQVKPKLPPLPPPKKPASTLGEQLQGMMND